MDQNETPDRENQLKASREFWDKEAVTFDNEPDHGLRAPDVRAAWQTLLRQLIAPTHTSILDMGCGTGSLSILLAEQGCTVTGIDVSPAMLALAEEKAVAAGYPVMFHIMDAAYPQFSTQHFDAIVCRHLLWALPDPAQVLRRWSELLMPGGSLHLIEGYWTTGGLHAREIIAAMPSSLTNISMQDLTEFPVLWGGPVTDERYVISATVKQS